MEISKSTPYVRYRENISSTLHKGTIHIESEYLDRERKTTIESIEGQTWQNMVNGENKEEEILPRLGLKIEGNEDMLDTVEQHMPIDTIIGDIEPVANEDGTYTYEISTMEGSYAKTLDGENNFLLTSDGLDGSMYIKYNAQGEEVNGNIVMTNGQKEYTIENSNTGEINGAVLKGSTKYRDIDTGDVLDTFDETKNLELVSVRVPILTTSNEDGTKTNTLTTPSDLELRKIGDIQDELDLETGVLTQRIEEVVLDGSENWVKPTSQSTNTTRFILTDFPNNKNTVIKSNFKIKKDSFSDEIGIWCDTNTIVNVDKSIDTIESFKAFLSKNPIELQYSLATPIITQVDITIKDQDDKIIHSLHTYPSTTHINLSSDGLIPDAEISYTMYGNIGETTGEKITDGTDSKLIEGKIYGDTLCNVLPSPSLKNSMDYNISMQKLNNGYDNINVADGEFKKATLYGQTLVNIFDNWESAIGSLTPIPTQDGYYLFTGDNVNVRVDLNNIPTFKRDVEYTFIYRIKNSTYDGKNDNTLRLEVGATTKYAHTVTNGIWKIKKSFSTDETNCFVKILSWVGSTGSAEVSLQIIKGDYTNQDIPYFEGMQSVVMPSLMTVGKNLLYDVEWEIDKRLLSDGGVGDFTGTNVSSYINVTNLDVITFSGFSKGAHCLYDKDKRIIGERSVSDNMTIDVSGVDYIRVTINNTIDYSNPQMETGSVATPYEPYQSNTLTTPEEVTLRAVGDVRDELDYVTGEVTQRIGEVVLDGSENWKENYVNTDETYLVARIENFLNTNVTLEETQLLCDKMKVSSGHNWSKEEKILINSGMLNVFIKKEKASNIDSFKTWLSQNSLTVQYILETPTISTVDISIVDQDGATQPKLHSSANGYINVTSQGSLPKVDYEVQTSNSYYLDMVKPNTQYTTKSSSDCNATIDGVIYQLSANGTFTTPSTITDNLMVLDAQVDDLMFIEGDVTGRELDYFTGLQSVDMPVLTTTGKNFVKNENSFIGRGDVTVEKNANEYTITTKDTMQGDWGLVEVEPSLKNLRASTRVFVYGEGSFERIAFTERNNMTDAFICTETVVKGEHGKSYTIKNDNVNLQIVFTNENQKNHSFTVSNIMIGYGEMPKTYEPHQSNILTTNEPISLHKIGDVKDELDLVNECVVRKTKCMIFDGSEDEKWVVGGTNSYGMAHFNYNVISNNIVGNDIPALCDKFNYINNGIHTREKECIGIVSNSIRLVIKSDRLSSVDITGFRQWLSENPITVIYELETPTTEPIRLVPQNRKQSTTSLTLQSPLQKVGNVADQLRWNPYKGHYVRYNYIQDGVANSTYTFEDLKDMNERKFVNLYNQRTYIDTDHTVQVNSHGISRYCLAEQDKQYQVRWDWVEQPSVDTIKVDLCGNVKEIPSTDNSVVIDVEKFTHQFVQIQGLGLTGKITNLMVIETIDSEIPDVDFFSGIQCVGNTVNIDGNTKVQIDMEQTNGNLFDNTIEIYNNGNNIRFMLDMVRPNKTYTLKYDNMSATKTMKYNQKQFNDGGQYGIQISNNGSANTHYKVELCYADMTKDGIRPRYYDKESIILPMKLCRVGNIYDNLYYDDLRGHYRIQQSIGHKYFTGGTTEVWTMETTNGYRTIKFTCTSANIDQIAYGETICNSFKHLSTINDDMEGFIIYNGNFVLRIDKDRLTDKTVDGFKALLASNQIHLFYQLKTPQMINLTEYPNRIELNTYRDEIFTFFKGMNPTKFTLSVPMDKTYRYAIAEEGQGLANRVTVNDETISAENMVAIKEVRGQGIANIIEDVNNVVITPRPNHEGRTTSHTLNNTKPATIMVHGFEPSGDTAIGKYNVTDKAYQLKVMSSNGDNSLSDYYVLNVPYKLETYADGTKDVVYYDEAYKQWHFKGSSVKEYTVASNGTLSETIEIFRGLAPRSGMIAEFKLMFTSGTTAARMYYSLDGITYGYTQLRGMSDGNYLYVGIFNTGGTKIDIAYKTDPNEEYTNLVPLSTQVPECSMINQITNCTFCELTLDKQYIYSEMKSPIELETYEGSTKVFMDGNATDTNIIIRNEGTAKIVNTYTDTTYTVYWKYVDGLGNLRVTLGGTTVEVDGKQEYATLKTQLNAPQELLYVGGYNLSIKDLMVVKGAKIDDLPYFEGSRQVGTLVLDEEGNKSYKITLVQGGSVLEQRDEDAIAFKDDNKHNVVVHKIVGVCPTKVD